MIGLEVQAKKISCRQHQKSIKFLSLNQKAKSKMLCSQCTQQQSVPLSKINELLIDINQDHPANHHIMELQNQFVNLKKELNEKVNQLLNETEKELSDLVASRLSDKFIQHYLYDDQLHDYDFDKLQELLCRYYEFEEDQNQIVARIPQSSLQMIYGVQMRCQKIHSIIKAFNKPKYYTKMGGNQDLDVASKQQLKQEQPKKHGLYKLAEDVQISSVCHCISFNNAGTKIVCGLQGNEKQENLIVLKLNDKKFLQSQVLEGHYGAVFSVLHSKLSNTIISGGEDKSLRIWKQQNGQRYNCEQIINEAHCEIIYCIVLNNTDNLMASGCKSGIIKLWFEVNDQWVNAQNLVKHESWIKAISFNFDCNFLASGSGDNSIIIWQLSEDWDHFQTLAGHTGFVNSIFFGKINQTKNLLVSGSEDQSIRIWEQGSKNQNDKFVCVQQLDGGYYVRSVCLNFNSLLLATGSYSNIKIWIRNQQGKYILNQEKYFDSRNIIFSEDSKFIGSVNRFSMNIRLFKIKSKKPHNK